MRQLTLRVDDRLVDCLKAAAGARGESVNAFAGRVLAAAVDPELAGDEMSRTRERLARAGLLETPGPPRGERPSEEDIARARVAAGRGKPLSDFISEGRGPY